MKLDDEEDYLPAVSDAGVMTAISRAELDAQITTARAFPRSIKRFKQECLNMATLTEEVAGDCIYATPRGGKTIDGPSVRLAEIVASAWGNCRSGARVVDEGDKFLTAQGLFHDLERNVQIQCEVRRRITDRQGKRFSEDMIATTSNAACSIAMRNAIFRGVPKAFWEDIYREARRVAVGDVKTLANKRAEAFSYLQKMGVDRARVLATLERDGEEDVRLEDLARLRGLITALRQGDTNVEEAFPVPEPGKKPASQDKTKTQPAPAGEQQ